MQTQSTVIETHSGRQKQSEFLPVTSEMLSTVDKTDVAEVSMNVQEAYPTLPPCFMRGYMAQRITQV
jgi:hypothetical protein